MGRTEKFIVLDAQCIAPHQPRAGLALMESHIMRIEASGRVLAAEGVEACRRWLLTILTPRIWIRNFSLFKHLTGQMSAPSTSVGRVNEDEINVSGTNSFGRREIRVEIGAADLLYQGSASVLFPVSSSPSRVFFTQKETGCCRKQRYGLHLAVSAAPNA
jgi:hypothetical protein